MLTKPIDILTTFLLITLFTLFTIFHGIFFSTSQFLRNPDKVKTALTSEQVLDAYRETVATQLVASLDLEKQPIDPGTLSDELENQLSDDELSKTISTDIDTVYAWLEGETDELQDLETSDILTEEITETTIKSFEPELAEAVDSTFINSQINRFLKDQDVVSEASAQLPDLYQNLPTYQRNILIANLAIAIFIFFSSKSFRSAFFVLGLGSLMSGIAMHYPFEILSIVEQTGIFDKYGIDTSAVLSQSFTGDSLQGLFIHSGLSYISADLEDISLILIGSGIFIAIASQLAIRQREIEEEPVQTSQEPQSNVN